MKNPNVFLTLVLLFIVSISSAQTITYEKVSADQLVKNSQLYENKYVETMGIIAHVCGVDGKKMKLKSPQGNVIKIIAGKGLTPFHKCDYNKKLLSVKGKVKLTYLTKEQIDELEKKQALLCSIDDKACIDKPWIERKKAQGKAKSLSQKQIKMLRQKLAQSESGKIVYVNIIADEVKKEE